MIRLAATRRPGRRRALACFTGPGTRFSPPETAFFPKTNRTLRSPAIIRTLSNQTDGLGASQCAPATRIPGMRCSMCFKQRGPEKDEFSRIGRRAGELATLRRNRALRVCILGSCSHSWNGANRTHWTYFADRVSRIAARATRPSLATSLADPLYPVRRFSVCTRRQIRP